MATAPQYNNIILVIRRLHCSHYNHVLVSTVLMNYGVCEPTPVPNFTVSIHRFSPEEKAKHTHLSHMPFGWGPLRCMGMRFGLMEMKLALIEILKKCKFVKAPDTEVVLKDPIQNTH